MISVPDELRVGFPFLFILELELDDRRLAIRNLQMPLLGRHLCHGSPNDILLTHLLRVVNPDELHEIGQVFRLVLDRSRGSSRFDI